MSKDLFLKDKTLAAAWRATAGSENFEKVLTYARSEIARKGPTQEEFRGCELMAHTLLTLADAEESDFVFPSPGLVHYTDSMPKRPEEQKARKQQKRK